MIPALSKGRFLLFLAAMTGIEARPAPAAIPAMPMPIIEPETANYRWLQKPVLASRLLDNAEQTNRWSHHGFGSIEFTRERAFEGVQSVRLTSPTTSGRPSPTKGRPFGEAIARLNFPGEDWTDHNRVSFRVYPHLPGFKVISLLVRLRNEGQTKVPDSYGREGLNFVLLKPDTWNTVVWEIAHLSRDKVTGLEFIYRLQGNEPGATNVVRFDLDQVELQRVVPDVFEGWRVPPGQLAYCHSGFELGAPKTALGQNVKASEFVLVRQEGNLAVFRKPIQSRKTALGEFQVLDFSEFNEPGVYRLETRGASTPWFRIGADVWRDSIWKTINLFYCERCGQAIPGIHDRCHEDWTAKHGDKSIVINGGWHDAGDLSQGLVNTAEAACAMLDLAETFSRGAAPDDERDALGQRLAHEALWGLSWMLKTRFGDGTRVTWATMDYWTDGVMGTPDDTLGDCSNSPFDNFLAAATEAKAARWLYAEGKRLLEAGRKERSANSTLPWAAGSADTGAQEALNAAREDWQFAVARARSPNLEVASAGVLASVELFKTTGEQAFADKAIKLAQIILQSQQREFPDWEIPLTGFFYTGPKRERILHYAHRGHEQAPVVALAELCRSFPRHRDWMRWYSGVVLHSEYLKRIAEFTEPWGMVPASVYSVEESRDARFKEQVRNGIRLSETHYLRRFPVWFDFRGNTGTGLSQAKALSAAARLRGDAASANLARRQLEWTVGRNPFGQSLMFGEGHDYPPQYTAMSGDMVGSLPVGIQTRENRDVPYWPAANCYNYKEVWVHPSSRWLGIMADLHQLSEERPDAAEAGVEFLSTRADAQEGMITIRATIRGTGTHRLTLRGSNLVPETPEQTANFASPPEQTLTWRARRESAKEPWIAVLLVDGKPGKRSELLGFEP